MRKTGSRLFLRLHLPCILFVSRSPGCHGVRYGFQAVSCFRQGIFHLRGNLRVYFACNKSCLFHGPEMAGKDFPGYAADGPHELVEPFCPCEQIPDDENLPFVSDEPQGRFRGTVRYFYSIIHIVSPPGISKVVWYKIDIGIIIYLRRKFDNGKGGRDMTRDMSRDMTRDMTFGEGDVRGILFMRVDPIITKN